MVAFANDAVCASGAETNWQPFYGAISGISMATPHAAGVTALILQAHPELTPDAVQKLMKDITRKVQAEGPSEADPTNPRGNTNVGYGAGLLDVPKRLDSLKTAK